MSQQTSDTVLNRLEAVQDQYHRQDLRSELDELGTELEALLVKRALYEELFDTSINIDEDFQSVIKEALDELEAENIETVEQLIEDIKEEKSEFETTLEQGVSGPLTKYRSDVESMERLNKKLDKVDSSDLEELEEFLQAGHLEDDLDHDSDDSIDEKLEHARSVGENKRAIYEKSIKSIFEPYLEDDTIGDIIEVLVANEDLRVDDLDPSEFESLHNSDLAQYIELQLG